MFRAADPGDVKLPELEPTVESEMSEVGSDKMKGATSILHLGRGGSTRTRPVFGSTFPA